jgi:hypothetical protein
MWFSARCLLRRGRRYRERLTLWRAASFGEAAVLAEDEARRFGVDNGWDYLDYVALYEITVAVDTPGHGDELYSLYRFIDLGSQAYRRRFLPGLCAAPPSARLGGKAGFVPHVWYTVRCLFQGTGPWAERFEERITLWHARSPGRAEALAKAEGHEYAEVLGLRLIGSCGVTLVGGRRPSHGSEIFAACRDRALDVEGYLDRFFDTGNERQRDLATGE